MIECKPTMANMVMSIRMEKHTQQLEMLNQAVI